MMLWTVNDSSADELSSFSVVVFSIKYFCRSSGSLDGNRAVVPSSVTCQQREEEEVVVEEEEGYRKFAAVL